MTPITPEQISALEHSLQMLDCGSKEVHRSTLTCVNDPEPCAVCERDELSAELTGEQAVIRELQAEAKHFYLADGTYEECESADVCVEKRKAAAKRIAELEGVEETVNAFKQGADGIHKLATEIIEGRAEITRLRAVPFERGPDGEPNGLCLGDYVDMQAELTGLRSSALQLNALQAAGVDNWEGYEDAMAAAKESAGA